MATKPANLRNFRSVSIRGVFNYARARVIWADGLLRVFTVDGMVLEVASKEPVRVPGYINAWDAETSKGLVALRTRCITCGGKKWWNVTFAPTGELWNSKW